MSEFWKRKIRRYFSTFDFDRDGVISKDDFVGMAIQYSKFGKEDQKKAELLKTQFENVRSFLDNCCLANRKLLGTIPVFLPLLLLQQPTLQLSLLILLP